MVASNRNVDLRVDLYSDTKTKPTPAMRQAMMDAEVGDEQALEDPTTQALQERVADLLGKETALFLPSGTMCNEIALAVHCRPGDAVIADATAHIIGFEGGGPGAIAGVNLHPIQGERGVFTVEQARAAIAPPANRYAARTRLIEFEQSANLGGGTVWPVERIEAIAELARDHGLVTHMDGARLLNATAAAGIPASTMAAAVDTVWIDLSKGLGCPIGGVLAGSAGFIDEAWRWKQRIGGAMRQSGILAAAGLYALDHHVDRLAEDNANARLFADLIAGLPGIDLNPEHVQTNIVFFGLSDCPLTGPEISKRLADRGIRIGAFSETRMRAVTHLEVDEAGIREAADALQEILK